MAAEAGGSLHLVLGPARSGKSRWAEHLAAGSGQRVVYLATGPDRPNDGAWQQRLAQHRRRRPAHWSTLELPDPQQLPTALGDLAGQHTALVDSLGSWVAAGLGLSEQAWEMLCGQLLQCTAKSRAHLIVVSEQTGWGVVPPTAIGGLFRDRLGSIERQLVARADASWLVVAGRAIRISDLGQAVPAD